MRRIILAALAINAVCWGTVRAQGRADSTADRPRKLYVVSTAHLDTQWRWTIRNTIDEYIPATMRENFKLMDAYPDYVFSFEGAFRYMLMREYYPREYERLKSYVARGQWRPCGSWVDAVDVNIPSLESLVRHALYGNGFFDEEFGVTSRDVFLPDCFGFGYALPSIAAHCGLKSFSTQKLTWGSSVGVPFDIGIWVGVDGSSVVAALNPGSYDSGIEHDLSHDETWLQRIDEQGASTGLYAAYKYFGTGDIGGAPDSLSVDWLSRSERSDGPITVRNVGSDDLTDLVAESKDLRLKRYRGELLMTRHGVGCYSSQAAMKRWNRKNELLADAAERASVIASMLGEYEYPRRILKDTWIRFLWHQFHDDLTGTSIPEAYQFSWNDEILCQNRFAGILENAVEAASAALDTRVKGVPLVVYNALSIPRRDVVEATVLFADGSPKAARVFDPLGQEVPSQIVEAGEKALRMLFLAEVPSVGYAVYDVRPAPAPCGIETGLRATPSEISNRRYVVKLDEHGDVSSILDVAEGRPVISEPIRWQLLHDKPMRWPAWEIQYEDICAAPEGYVGGAPEVRVLENGPVRVSTEVVRRKGASAFRTVIRLCAQEAGDRVEFDNDVDWYESETLLKAAFAPAVRCDSVTYDLGLGSIKRGLNKPELYEVPGHQWADVTAQDGRYGVAVLNDCKYGWDHPGAGTLRLTLIHTPGVYDNWSWVGDQRSQDIGHHRFAFALLAHRGDWREGEVAWQAARFNQPLVAFQATRHSGVVGRTFSLLRAENGGGSPGAAAGGGNRQGRVMVNAVKLAERGDEVVVRLRELNGARAENIRVELARPVTEAREVNGVEGTVGSAEIVDGVLIASLAPYQPKAFAMRLAGVEAREKPAPVFKALRLPFDVDGISADGEAGDGSFDNSGNTISGDLLPDTLVSQMIPFVIGPRTPGAKNVVACNGQTIALPSGPFNRIYILGAAISGPAIARFSIEGAPEVRVFDVAMQDYAVPIGQWNSRLVAGELVEEPGLIAPSYINRETVAWVGTHRHGPAGENESYQYTYLYSIRLDLPGGARSLKLPQDGDIRLLGATLARVEWDDTRPAGPLYDEADNTLTSIHAARKTFIDSLVVEITCPIPGAEIHYTLDGSDPTVGSPLYEEPIVLTGTAVVRSRAVKDGADDSYVAGATFTKCVPEEADRGGGVVPGLRCSYYEGEWTELPDFGRLPPVREAVRNAFGIPGFAREEDFGLVFDGYVEVPRDGVYDFYVSSDDGSRLIVGAGTTVDNDGLHGEQERSCEIALKAGLHPIAVYMFQGKGDRCLEVSIRGPGLNKQPIPREMLYHRE